MTGLTDNETGWLEYRRLILSELERISKALGEVDKKVDALRTDDLSSLKVEIAMLKVKSGAWGGLGGLIVVLATVLVKFLGG